MFLVDKYSNDSFVNKYLEDKVIEVLNSFNIHHENIELNNDDKFMNNIKTYINGDKKFVNFSHLILYGDDSINKQYFINRLLENIYGQVNTKEETYMISGYSNTYQKVSIMQSENHIILKPNSNGFDKYMIHEIIEEFFGQKQLSIFDKARPFRIAIINKVDNLSFYAQASLRRTMEKYSDRCKFILISNQLSKVIDPIRSRCNSIRLSMPSKQDILASLLYVSLKEKIKINNIDLYEILYKSKNKMSMCLWLLEFYKYEVVCESTWENIIDEIVELIIGKNNMTSKKIFTAIKTIREKFYILFITNITTQTIMQSIIKKLLEKNNDIEINYKTLCIFSKYQKLLNLGTRHILHFEACIFNIIKLYHSSP